MDQRPKITISSLDAERLEEMIDSLGNNQFPGKEELLAEISRADIVEPNEMPSNIVTMNSKVKFKNKSSDKEFSLTLVYPNNSSGEATVSILAPVGSALLGLTEGDEIEWPKPGGGVLSVKIIEIEYQPEREGEFHR
ncbi:nucleoside diphosphate kinase regulator [Cocleimonas flava]|uniref:GreA/GreB family elongation factor n=1 Tax=Cocleimonas flava TaxID=634765 RepID=A0A4R1EWY3_9GAMM|nr:MULTISPECIES: nucleoside diphosphate kinase regulator [Cocleimonas]MEB8433663.1 nucleoside diphosphate kinase regulator [Cocleimonas sp. KMM 6892]MEC4716474.1 nucleoside diphosphate kinase regulator [Cocleimonas sp. KMM 6895]MEC4745633.1 nucleoside diphosphate kinase regulator [Cocleimonas sp. KMM 6896]TCJ85310.1 GreA/GreB family elongation factor [Cocleimonas flava]